MSLLTLSRSHALLRYAFFCLCAQASGPRLALCVGVSKYTTMTPLPCCRNDATDMAKALKARGFRVTLLLEPTQKKLQHALFDWLEAAEQEEASCLFFYFSGHGAEGDGKNYLIPLPGVEKALSDDAVELQSKLYTPMNRINVPHNFVVLDACRQNESDTTWKSKGLKGPAASGVNPKGDGLGDTRLPTMAQFFTMYACDPGTVAFGGKKDERNSLLTRHLLKHLKKGVTQHELGMAVTKGVLEETYAQQRPVQNSSCWEDFVF